jgi:hypothetical protein
MLVEGVFLVSGAGSYCSERLKSDPRTDETEGGVGRCSEGGPVTPAEIHKGVSTYLAVYTLAHSCCAPSW